MFDPKTIHIQKTLGLKVLDPRKCWVKKKIGPKSFVPKIKVKNDLCPKNVRSNKFWVLKILGKMIKVNNFFF